MDGQAACEEIMGWRTAFALWLWRNTVGEDGVHIYGEGERGDYLVAGP